MEETLCKSKNVLHQVDPKIAGLSNRKRFKLFWLVLFITCFTFASLIIAVVVMMRPYNNRLIIPELGSSTAHYHMCRNCHFTMVESIPENLTFVSGSAIHVSVYDSWVHLLDLAEKQIDIASSYWTLRDVDINRTDPSANLGEDILKRLVHAGKERKIKIRIVQSQPSAESPDNDTRYLQAVGAAEVRSLNMQRLIGAGILHTKMWLIDGLHFYVGSANMDWRSLTQVKELGAVVYNCSCLAQDMQKIFDVYWKLATPDAVVPKKWPTNYATSYNSTNPMLLKFNESESSAVYLASSPPKLCPDGRTSDIDAILSIIDGAEEYVNIAVMDYLPLIQYQYPNTYWPVIDSKLRQVAFNKRIHIRLLISFWPHTNKDTFPFLRSLNTLSFNNSRLFVEVKLFIVPSFTPEQQAIPYARVNHNKYMVTDKTAYIGTSNWSGDYFVSTCGIGFVITSSNNHSCTIRDDLHSVFNRDWNSTYARNLSDFVS